MSTPPDGFVEADHSAFDARAYLAQFYTTPHVAEDDVILRFVGPQADVWALGVILYEALTGQRPFDGDTSWTILHRVITAEPVSPRKTVPAIPRDLEIVCLKCLGKEPHRRYATAAELAADLGRVLAGEPVSARRPGVVERARRWARQNPTRAALAAMSVVVAVFAVWAWSAYRAKVADDRTAAAVEKLAAADTARVPELLDELDAHGGDAEPHLRRQLADAPAGSARELHLRLALLPRDPGQVEPLAARLFDAPPAAVAVLVDRLRPHAAALAPGLWRAVQDPATDHDRRFRAACVLAQFDPDHPDWPGIASTVVERLLVSNLADLATWARLLGPVGRHLAPPLDAAFAAEAADGRRSTAAAAVAELGADPTRLLALTLAASPAQLGELVPALRRHAGAVRSGLTAALDTPIPPKPPTELSDWEQERIAPAHAVRARAALALLHLGDDPAAWDRLRFTPDPQTRTFLTNWFAESRFPLDRLLNRLRAEPDATVRRALLYAVGEYPRAAMTPRPGTGCGSPRTRRPARSSPTGSPSPASRSTGC